MRVVNDDNDDEGDSTTDMSSHLLLSNYDLIKAAIGVIAGLGWLYADIFVIPNCLFNGYEGFGLVPIFYWMFAWVVPGIGAALLVAISLAKLDSEIELRRGHQRTSYK